MDVGKLKGAIHSSMYHQLQKTGVASRVQVLIDIEILSKEDHEKWRIGKVDYLERVCQTNLRALTLIAKEIRAYARDQHLKPSWTYYRQWGCKRKSQARKLRFSKSGDERIEREYATHYVDVYRVEKAKLVIANKQLKQKALEELWQLFPVIIAAYDPKWQDRYRKEKKNLNDLLKQKNIARIEHIGSTSVAGLCAKPTIDILLEIKQDCDLSKLVEKLEWDGYLYEPQPRNPAPRMMFMKGYTLKGFADEVYHVHIRYSGDWDELYFRDYLCEHSSVAAEYGVLKQKWKEMFEHNRDAYTEAKSDWIMKYTRLAREAYPGRYSPS